MAVISTPLRPFKQSNYDSLTGLPSRDLIFDRLQQALKYAARSRRRFTVAMLDIDQFKAINNYYGRLIGNVVLCEVAARVQGCLREGDTVGRLGGDEFTLILPDIKQRAEAIAVVKKIITACSEGFPVDGKTLSISVSIGTAIYPLDGQNQHALLASAELAMSNVKAMRFVQ